MKRYKDYMDGVEASDTLHQRLTELEAPQKRPAAWKKYGAAAAALLLVAGVGAWQSQGGWGALMENFRPAAEVAPEIADVPAPYPNPDIANEDDPYAPADRTGGGYELIDGEMAVYYGLPYLEWADASQGTELDYSLAPPGAIDREATWNDVLLFTGGEKAMADHLLWDGLDWDGTVWFVDEFTPCAALLYAEGDGLSFSLEVMLGGEVPSCEVLPEKYYETSLWQGTRITAVKNGGSAVIDGVRLDEKREVGLLYANHVGYKLTLYAADAQRADEMCARFVRYAVAGGFQLDALSADGAVDHSGFSVGEPNWEDGIPDKGFPPEDMPTANILHPGDEGYVEPFPAPDGVPEEDSAPQTTPYNPSARS